LGLSKSETRSKNKRKIEEKGSLSNYARKSRSRNNQNSKRRLSLETKIEEETDKKAQNYRKKESALKAIGCVTKEVTKLTASKELGHLDVSALEDTISL
jgi:hypothetical protein